MRSELTEDEYQSLLDGAVGDLDTFLDMFFAADWRETNEVVEMLSDQLARFSKTWENARSANRYTFRVSDERQHRMDIAIQQLKAEISDLKAGRVRVQRRWQIAATRYCMSLYWLERGGTDKPSASEIMRLFHLGTKAKPNEESQGIQFIVDARRRAVSEFIARKQTAHNKPDVAKVLPDTMRTEGWRFVEKGDDKDLDLSGAIFESVRKIAKEWEREGRMPDPSEFSPLNDRSGVWVDET